jgi:branched-chain amino acid transport system ATP-binding protein
VEGHLLSLNNIEVVYDGVILVLKGISLVARERSITALLGGNGAGKTTTLKAIAGVLAPERGQVTKGAVEFDGVRLDQLPAHEVVRRGVTQVFEGRRVFENLTVEENLIAGGHVQRDAKLVRDGIDWVYQVFPLLKERRHRQAGYLSGGEQQMLAIGRALMSAPKVILLDEPSLGLAPRLVEEIARVIQRLKDADHGYVMENGRIVLEGAAESLRGNADVKEFYLGLNENGLRRSYRDVKRYRRRKRWLS